MQLDYYYALSSSSAVFLHCDAQRKDAVNRWPTTSSNHDIAASSLSRLRVNIMQSYCTSFYGSQLWDLSSNIIERLCTSLRKSIRKAMNIPMRTHCVYVPLLCNCLPLRMQIETRSVKFYVQGLNSKNDVFCFLLRSATLNRVSTV